jgi:hypothetical protein
MISSTYLIIHLQNQSYNVVTYVNSNPAPQSPFPVRWYSYPTTIIDFLRELHPLRLNRESPQRIIYKRAHLFKLTVKILLSERMLLVLEKFLADCLNF